MGDETKKCPQCAEPVRVQAVLCKYCKYDFRTGQPAAAPPAPARRGGLPVWIILLIICGAGVPVIAIVAAIAIPGLLAAQSAANERNASATLKTLTSAQADFRSNDRDGDRIANFWVRDVHSLHTLCPSSDGASVPTPDPSSMIRLIEPSLAAADIAGKPALPGAVPGPDAFGLWSPKTSYAFRPFDGTDSGPYGEKGAIAAYGDAYNHSSFAFMAVPVTTAGGKRIFIVNEDNTIYTARLLGLTSSGFPSGTATPSMTFETTINGVRFTQNSLWPADPRSSGWTRLD